MRINNPITSLAQLGVKDHDLLSGLGDDDHGIYLNVARHDLAARHPLANLDVLVCSEAEAAGLITVHRTEAGAHDTLTRITTHDHDLLEGLGDDDHAQYLNTARHDVVARHPGTILDILRKNAVPGNKFYIPGWYVETLVSDTVTAGRIIYQPIYVHDDTTFKRIGIYVATLSAGTCDLRIFAFTNGLPGAQILSAGTVDTGATGWKEIAIDQLLTRGWYFLASRFTGTPNCRLPDTGTSMLPASQGYAAAGGSPSRLINVYYDGAYANPAVAFTGALHCYYSPAWLGVV
ncbi:HlyD family secretion protein [Candidatus Bathyarchaeota archaeon]|nr:HlyD family secretion protein [Candidatus Bathyarchaeota archaeon]